MRKAPFLLIFGLFPVSMRMASVFIIMHIAYSFNLFGIVFLVTTLHAAGIRHQEQASVSYSVEDANGLLPPLINLWH